MYLSICKIVSGVGLLAFDGELKMACRNYRGELGPLYIPKHMLYYLHKQALSYTIENNTIIESHIMATYPHQSYMTVEEYFELCRNSPDARYEYIDGQAVMLAGGSLNHSRIAANIIGLLQNLLQGGCQAFTSDAMVKVPSRRYVLPDVTITCDERDHEDNEYLLYPCVIFEVLSPTTEAY